MNAPFLYIGAGLALLALGGEGVIRGGVTLKRALGVAPVIIGLFALSLGTSSPVLAVAIEANSAGIADMALGVVIGATLINLLLILGLGALIAPMPSAPKVVLRDGGAMLLASTALVLLSTQSEITQRDGVFLVGAFAVYAIIAVVSDWQRSADHSVACAAAEERSMGARPSMGGGLFALIIGVICLILGAHFLLSGSAAFAAMRGLPVATVALTVMALAASLPVLVVTAIAALRGHTQIAIGHLMMASIFNLLGVLGVTALVKPVAISGVFGGADVFVVLGASVALLPLLSANWQLSRLKGALLVLAYVGYVGFVAWRQGMLPNLPL